MENKFLYFLHKLLQDKDDKGQEQSELTKAGATREKAGGAKLDNLILARLIDPDYYYVQATSLTITNSTPICY